MKCLTSPVAKHESLFARILEIMYINDFFLSVIYNIIGIYSIPDGPGEK